MCFDEIAQLSEVPVQKSTDTKKTDWEQNAAVVRAHERYLWCSR